MTKPNEPDVNVFFAPTGSQEIWERALKRRLGLWTNDCEAGAESELGSFVIVLWHLNTYSWAGLQQSGRNLAGEWLRLANILQHTEDHRVTRILVLTPEEPNELSVVPHARFIFPDLLFRAILNDQKVVKSAQPFMKCVTYASFENMSVKASACDSLIHWPKNGSKDTMLIRFCFAMAALPQRTLDLCPETSLPTAGDRAQFIRHEDLFRFFSDPKGFRAQELHGSGPERSRGDQGLTDDERLWARKVSVLEHIMSRIVVPQRASIKILVIENDFLGLLGWGNKSFEQHDELWKSDVTKTIADCFGYFDYSELYVIDSSEDFEKLRSGTQRSEVRARLFVPRKHKLEEFDSLEPISVPWDQLDLVLQDVMLDKTKGARTGLDYVSYYIEACPQALVFVLTGMDIESLSMSGEVNHKYVDAVVSKRKLGSLWWIYFQAFCRVFGKMFWRDVFSSDIARRERPRFGDRESLRNLFGSLRCWQMEPSILGHGQGLPEMIDHSHRHIAAHWRLMDDFVSTIMECTGFCNGPLSVENRMLLALSVWLHDIGHRGNEFTDDPADVRNTHGGISEYLLLRNPAAYGLQWLSEFCSEGCSENTELTPVRKNPRLRWRNHVRGCQQDGNGEELCAIRKVGVLCRHHQSNAPLNAESLIRMCTRGKFPSPYTRYKNHGSNSQLDLEEWLNRSEPLSGWSGSNVRLLQDFAVGNSEEFMTIAGLLRMIDGLQVHRARVGSPSSVRSFNEFLRVRSDWVDKELERVDVLITDMLPGSKEYHFEIEKRFALERYQRLLNTQYVHWWRQLAVHDVKVKWHWNAGNSRVACDQFPRGIVEIEFELDDVGLSKLDELHRQLEVTKQGQPSLKSFSLKHVLNEKFTSFCGKKSQFSPSRQELVDRLMGIRHTNIRLWAAHVAEEMIWGEHDSQLNTINGRRECPAYINVLPRGAGLRITTIGSTSQHVDDPPLVLLVSGESSQGGS